jgi:TRAP-type uncharacterized transport system substrate-binding protein
VLSNGDTLRIIPVVGIGGPQNIRDVRNLKGIDIGLTQTSILNNYRRSNEILGLTDDKIVYIARLFNLEIHLVTRSNIVSLDQLRGEKVNFDELGSGTNYTMREIFKRLGINVQEVNLPQTEALEKLKNGEILATALVAGKPAQSMSLFKRSDGLKFLSIPIVKELNSDFLPTELTSRDYPDMIPAGERVSTIADTAVLVAYNWPKDTDRYRRVKTFVDAFFSNIDEFRLPPHHVKWREVNIASKLPGWTRIEAADQWLGNAMAERGQAEQARGFQDRPVESGGQGRLLREFEKWRHGAASQ